MNLALTRRTAAVIALLALAVVTVFALSFGTARADSDAPAPGTQACTDAVNLNTDIKLDRAAVQTALDDLNTAKKGGDPTTIANAQNTLDAAQATLNTDVRNVTIRVCTGKASGSSTTTTTKTSDPTPPANDEVTAAGLRLKIAELTCANFDAQTSAIQYESAKLAKDDDVSASEKSALSTAFNAKVASLGCGEKTTTVPAPSTSGGSTSSSTGSSSGGSTSSGSSSTGSSTVDVPNVTSGVDTGSW